MTTGPPANAILGAILNSSRGHNLDDFDVDLAGSTVRLFGGPTTGPGIGHVTEARRDGNRLALILHINSTRGEALETLQAIDAGIPPGLDIQLAGGGGQPGARRRPRLIALKVAHHSGWPGSELSVLDRGAALTPSQTLTARRRQRLVIPPRPRVRLIDGPAGWSPRPHVNLNPTA